MAAVVVVVVEVVVVVVAGLLFVSGPETALCLPLETVLRLTIVLCNAG